MIAFEDEMDDIEQNYVSSLSYKIKSISLVVDMAAVLPAIFNNYNTNIRLKITILNHKYYSNAQRFSILYWETQARVH